MREAPRIDFRSVQWALWLLAVGALFAYSFFKFARLDWAIVNTILVSLMYGLAVYGHSHFLLPRYFQRNLGRYIVFSVIFLVGIIALRMILEYVLLHKLLRYTYFYDFNHEHFSFTSVTMVFAFLFGGLFRISINYFLMLQSQQEIRTQQAIAELNLLKGQVQPHFLFNALNNIYYLSITGSEKAPEAIGRLSEAMRYFVDVAPREAVSLKAELDFIRDYMEVERIRIPGHLNINFEIDAELARSMESIMLPSMLLIPFVENVFKHGVDKTRHENTIDIQVTRDRHELKFVVRNPIAPDIAVAGSGNGLSNLRRRLALHFPDKFVMITGRESDHFVSRLQIPIDDDDLRNR